MPRPDAGPRSTTAPIGEAVRPGAGMVLLPFALAYFLSYFVRSINAVIAPDLAEEFGLDAAGLGLVTAAYFCAMAASQIPLGMAYDRFGAQPVQALALAVAAAGALLFATGGGFASIALGRFLIGLGVAGCLMSAFTLMTQALPARCLPFGYGVVLAFGGVGALAATAPAQWLLELVSWRGLFFGAAAAFLVLAAAILLSPRLGSPTPERGRFAALLRGLGDIYRDRLFWRLAPLTVACFGAGSAIQGLWVGPWLRDVGGFSRPTAALLLFLMTLMLTIGSVLSGAVAERLARRGIGTIAVVGWGVALFLAAQAAVLFEPVAASWLVWSVFGLAFNVASLNFSILGQAFARDYAGRVNTALNVMVTLGSFAVQYGMGVVIALWPPAASGGYEPEAYRAAFGAALILEVAAFAWFLLPGRLTPAGRASRPPGR